jgi:hypothetical protein
VPLVVGPRQLPAQESATGSFRGHEALQFDADVRFIPESQGELPRTYRATSCSGGCNPSPFLEPVRTIAWAEPASDGQQMGFVWLSHHFLTTPPVCDGPVFLRCMGFASQGLPSGV